MSKLYTTEAIIIKNKDYQEYDKLVTAFSPYHGRISAVVKGVKKPKSKLASVVQSFTYGSYQFHSGKNLDRLVQGKPIHAFAHIKEDLSLMSAGMCMLELLDKAVPEAEEYPALFGVSLSCFYLLEHGYPPAQVLRLFEAKLIDNLGVTPNFHHCINHTGEPDSGERWYFDPSVGGLICESCFEAQLYGHETHAFPVEKGSVKVLQRMFNYPIYKLKSLRLTQLQSDTVEKILENMLNYHFGITCHTKTFFETSIGKQ